MKADKEEMNRLSTDKKKQFVRKHDTISVKQAMLKMMQFYTRFYLKKQCLSVYQSIYLPVCCINNFFA